jgi:hypothetical protein
VILSAGKQHGAQLAHGSACAAAALAQRPTPAQDVCYTPKKTHHNTRFETPLLTILNPKVETPFLFYSEPQTPLLFSSALVNAPVTGAAL